MHHLSFTSAFLTLTLHYTNDEMEECTITLEVAPFDTDHTGEGIKDKFLELFHKWRLDKDYCVMLVLDGASNMTLAAKKMGLKDVNEEFLVDFDRHQQHTNNQ